MPQTQNVRSTCSFMCVLNITFTLTHTHTMRPVERNSNSPSFTTELKLNPDILLKRKKQQLCYDRGHTGSHKVTVCVLPFFGRAGSADRFRFAVS